MSQKKAREARRSAGTAAAKRQPAGKSPSAGRSSKTWLVIAGSVAAVVVVLVAGIFAARGTGPAQAVSVSSSSSLSIAGTDPVTGKSVSLASYAGKPIVLNVWASWCSGCRAEAVDLRRFAELHPETQVIGLDQQDTAGGARGFYAEFGWKHPSIEDQSGGIAKNLGLQGLPTTYFLDSSHRIVTRIVGETNLAGFEQGLAAAQTPS